MRHPRRDVDEGTGSDDEDMAVQLRERDSVQDEDALRQQSAVVGFGDVDMAGAGETRR